MRILGETRVQPGKYPDQAGCVCIQTRGFGEDNYLHQPRHQYLLVGHRSDEGAAAEVQRQVPDHRHEHFFKTRGCESDKRAYPGILRYWQFLFALATLQKSLHLRVYEEQVDT